MLVNYLIPTLFKQSNQSIDQNYLIPQNPLIYQDYSFNQDSLIPKNHLINQNPSSIYQDSLIHKNHLSNPDYSFNQDSSISSDYLNPKNHLTNQNPSANQTLQQKLINQNHFRNLIGNSFKKYFFNCNTKKSLTKVLEQSDDKYKFLFLRSIINNIKNITKITDNLKKFLSPNDHMIILNSTIQTKTFDDIIYLIYKNIYNCKDSNFKYLSLIIKDFFNLTDNSFINFLQRYSNCEIIYIKRISNEYLEVNSKYEGSTQDRWYSTTSVDDNLMKKFLEIYIFSTEYDKEEFSREFLNIFKTNIKKNLAEGGIDKLEHFKTLIKYNQTLSRNFSNIHNSNMKSFFLTAVNQEKINVSLIRLYDVIEYSDPRVSKGGFCFFYALLSYHLNKKL